MSLLALRVSECQRKCKCINNPEVISRYTAISCIPRTLWVRDWIYSGTGQGTTRFRYIEDFLYIFYYFGGKENRSLYREYHTACLKTSLLSHLPCLNKADWLIDWLNQKREAQNQTSAQRLLQSHDSEQRVLFFLNNISASHTSLVRSGLQMLLNLCRNHNII